MKWTYNIKNKLLASIVLLALCLLVLLNNYLERVHSKNVQDSISTMYEDRLIVEDYILKMTATIYKIREVLQSDISDASKAGTVGKHIADFNNIYKAYLKTKFTTIEKATAIELINSIKKFELAILNNDFSSSGNTDQALASLQKLSAVQLDESKLIMKSVESQYATIKASSQFAFAIIILILIVLQIIVFSSGSIIPGMKPNDPRLN